MTARVAFAACSFFYACSGSPPEAASPLTPKCGDGPVFDAPAPELQALTSRLSLHTELPISAIEESLSRSVPTLLAKADGRSMGAAGKVSYQVKRGPLHLALGDDVLTVTTQLTADIDVCKPLGPVCLHYGACQPQWSAKVTVPLPDSLEDPPSPKLDLGITKGCVLRPVGYDATPELRRITEDQARNARGQIQRQVADQYAEMLHGLERVRRGVRFGEGEDECLRFEPTGVERTRVKEGDALELDVSVVGRIEWGCTAPRVREPYEGGPEPIPITVVETLAPETALHVGREEAYAIVAAQLAAQGGSATLSAGRVGGRTHLFAGVRGQSSCDPEWLAVDPRLDGDTLVFAPSPLEGPPSAGAKWLTAHGRAASGMSAVGLQARVVEFELKYREELERELGKQGLKLEGTLHPSTSVGLGPTSLRPTVTLGGVLSILPVDGAATAPGAPPAPAKP